MQDWTKLGVQFIPNINLMTAGLKLGHVRRNQGNWRRCCLRHCPDYPNRIRPKKVTEILLFPEFVEACRPVQIETEYAF
jgi:hypothetical protein